MDLESGYGTDPATVSETVTRAMGIGVVGFKKRNRGHPLDFSRQPRVRILSQVNGLAFSESYKTAALLCSRQWLS